MKPPFRDKFLASQNNPNPDAIILGVPLDKTESFRSGTKLAPERIRKASDSLETFSPTLRKDLEDIVLCDWGDIKMEDSMEISLERIEEEVVQAREKAFTVLIGGEHTLTLAAIRALKREFSPLFLIEFDAHLDLRESYEGEKFCHATVTKRILEEIGGSFLIQLGVRSGTREEYEISKKCLLSTPDISIPSEIRDKIGDSAVYMSIDMDVLDPSCAPGTSNPEPGGYDFKELLSSLYELKSLNVVGMDVIEVSPPFDRGDITSIAAAKIIRESILLFT
ncbi:MAG: agmatinase [Actinomycetota bacterium]